MPVHPELVIDEFGKSMLRARERILVSPSRIIVPTPQFFSSLLIDKRCGFFKKDQKLCSAEIICPKSFYRAGEIVYIEIKIDNSRVPDDCSLMITQCMNV